MARRHLSATTPTADGPLQVKLDEHDDAIDALEAVDAAILSSSTPAAIGTAAVGVGTTAARADHVHALPSLVTGATKGGSGKLIKTIQYDAKGRIEAAVVDGVAGTDYVASVSDATPANIGTAAAGVSAAASRADHVHALVRDFEGTVRAKAASNMGVAESVVVGRFLMPALTAVAPAGSVQAVARTFNVDRAYRMSTGGGAAGFAHVGLTGINTSAAAGTQSPKLILPGTSRWWIGGQFALNTAVAATALAGLVLAEVAAAATVVATADMFLGARGPSSVGNFYLYGAVGTPMDLGVAIDTAAHRFDAWSDGTTTYAQVDGGTILTGNARPSVKCALPAAFVFDSAIQAPALAMDVYWWAGYIDGGLA